MARSTHTRVLLVLSAFALGACEKLAHNPADLAAGPDNECADETCAPADDDDAAPEVEMDPDPLYLERAQAALAAWQLDLDTGDLAALRTMGDDFTAHNPPHWITVADESCAAEGVGDGLRADCPLNEAVIGVCETRYYPDTGEIVDTTLVVFDGFQEGDASEADKLAVFVHEIGHCMGLRHSDTEQHVMYPTTSGADMPANVELGAVAKAYLPTAQEPPKGIADKFFAKTSAGATVRIMSAPAFAISGTIGTEVDRSFDPPAPGTRLRPGVAVARHTMRADGNCEDAAHRN